MHCKKAFGLAAVACAALALTPDAQAFCRTTTVRAAPDFQPDLGKCWSEGVPLYWANSCVGYSLQRDASRQLDLATASRLVDEAFNTWNAAACSGGAAHGDGGAPSQASARLPSIHAAQLGNVACDQVTYSQTGPNQNTIVFRDHDWPHSDANETMAFTTLTFDATTGEIFDADMEINTAQTQFTVRDPVPADGFDLLALLTHEAGHFLGLAHSPSTDATLFPRYQVGSTTQRYLAADDVAAICEVYRPSGERVTAAGLVPAKSCDPTPRHGFSAECPAPSSGTKNGWACTATPGSVRNVSVATGFLTLLACAVARRRRRRPDERRDAADSHFMPPA